MFFPVDEAPEEASAWRKPFRWAHSGIKHPRPRSSPPFREDVRCIAPAQQTSRSQPGNWGFGDLKGQNSDSEQRHRGDAWILEGTKLAMVSRR